jgi:hypothetical protein
MRKMWFEVLGAVSGLLSAKEQKPKTYNSTDSLVVTDLTTNMPV